jgi:hypothetical protein
LAIATDRSASARTRSNRTNGAPFSTIRADQYFPDQRAVYRLDNLNLAFGSHRTRCAQFRRRGLCHPPPAPSESSERISSDTLILLYWVSLPTYVPPNDSGRTIEPAVSSDPALPSVEGILGGIGQGSSATYIVTALRRRRRLMAFQE